MSDFDKDVEYMDFDNGAITDMRPLKNKKEKLSKDERPDSLLREILVNSLYLLIVLVVTLCIVKFVGQRTVVVGSSMSPTLTDADNLIVDKISYRFGEPERFDIIVFPFQYDQSTYYIKRIIGLPGESVRIDEAGVIYIDGQVLDEHYGAETIEDPGIAYEEIILGEGEYFVLGDNRNNSSDSRTVAVGNIKREDIIGRAWLRVYPFSSFGLVKHGE